MNILLAGYNKMAEAMKRRGRTKPEQLDEDFARVTRLRNDTHAILEQAKAARDESLDLASLGDEKAAEAVQRADASIAHLTNALAMYDDAIQRKHLPALEEKRAYEAAQARQAKIEALNVKLAERLVSIEELEAALSKAATCLNNQHELIRQIDALRRELIGNPELDAAGHRFRHPYTLEHPRVVERVSRFWQHVEGSLWIDPTGFGSTSDQRVPSLLDAERQAQLPYRVEA